MINNYKYITTIYFKRAFFNINSKGFLTACKPGTSFRHDRNAITDCMD